MSSLEKNQLMHQVQSDWLLPGISMPDVKDILDALKPYISLKKESQKRSYIVSCTVK